MLLFVFLLSFDSFIDKFSQIALYGLGKLLLLFFLSSATTLKRRNRGIYVWYEFFGLAITREDDLDILNDGRKG